MTSAYERLIQLLAWLTGPVMNLGSVPITIGKIAYFILLAWISIYVAGILRVGLIRYALQRTRLDAGARESVGSIARYAAICLGWVLSLHAIGLDLTTFSVVAGAIGIGLGFGLQNTANNFISGLIILIERPIKIGDRIEVEGANGEVVDIGARSTTVLTNDHISIIVPNSLLVTNTVTNWKHSGSSVRFHIPVTVAFDCDVTKVQQLLLEVALEDDDVLKEPPAKVWLRKFGENGLLFDLLVWNSSLVHRKGQLVSNLNLAVLLKFRKHGIVLPYPQRELHIRRPPVASKDRPELKTNVTEKSTGESHV